MKNKAAIFKATAELHPIESAVTTWKKVEKVLQTIGEALPVTVQTFLRQVERCPHKPWS